ncbi:MAG: hypothetical protein JW885_14600 [Deltaproteobacteria bacterium]|nr:hypothetical protein [Candidatus Zymogenaceae bacterium]
MRTYISSQDGNSTGTLLVILAVIMLILFGLATNFHLVRTDDDLVVVKKESIGLSDTYVDTRGWSFIEWEEHPALMRTMEANEPGEVIRFDSD